MSEEPAPPFPYSNIGFQIGRAARDTRAMLDARLADAGTTFATWAVLATLEAHGPLVQRDLARHLDVEGPTVVRRVDRLEGDGLVRRTPVATDRRSVTVELTPEGRALHGRLRAAVEAGERALESSVDAADLATTRRVLQRLAERARELRSG
jgi:MarR family transcriptional regulator for hemolysin